MIRYAVLLLNMLGLFVYQLFFTGDVTVTQLVPPEMASGSSYTIEVSISKGAIGGFAKLQQELPAGCTATVIEGKGASFSMNGSAVKFIWTSLPAETDFKVSYSLSISSTTPVGSKDIGGKFYYVADNVKNSVEVPVSTVNITCNAVSVVTPDTSKT